MYLACQELKSILWWRQDQNTLTVSHHSHHYWHLLFGNNWQHKSTKQQQKVFSFDLVNLSLRNLSYLPMKYYVLLCMKLTTNPEPWREGFSANWPASLVSMVAFNAHNNPTWTCFTNSILQREWKLTDQEADQDDTFSAICLHPNSEHMHKWLKQPGGQLCIHTTSTRWALSSSQLLAACGVMVSPAPRSQGLIDHQE